METMVEETEQCVLYSTLQQSTQASKKKKNDVGADASNMEAGAYVDVTLHNQSTVFNRQWCNGNFSFARFVLQNTEKGTLRP